MCRKCGESDRRGSSKVRRQRRRRLLEGAGGVTTGGNGVITACVWCGHLVGDIPGHLRVVIDGRVRHLRIRKLEQDRIRAGGPYSLWNLAAACGQCNRARVYDDLEIIDGCLYGPSTREGVIAARAARQLAATVDAGEATA